jgi:hypothetical protein
VWGPTTATFHPWIMIGELRQQIVVDALIDDADIAQHWA